MRPSAALFRCAFLLGAGLSAAVQPPPDRPVDYRYALPLQVSGKQGVVGFRLPTVVYQRAQTAQLDDLRMFDAEGRPQPFALYLPRPKAPEQRSLVRATIFPVKALPEADTTAVNLDIQTRADGSLARVQARTGHQPATGSPLNSLLLDFGARALSGSTRIEALRFTPPPGHRDYTAEVWLETSADLKSWETVGAAELSWLTSADAETLTNDRLEFDPRAFRYARLTWRRGVPLQFAAIQAETVTRNAAEPTRETLWIQPTAGKVPGDLAYPVGIALPVDQIALRFTEPNIVYPVALGQYTERPSRHSGNPTEWVFQAQGHATFYQITQNGQARHSGPLQLAGGHALAWVLRPQSPGATARPELGVSWQQATLVFLAGGTPPYTLAFGRAEAQNAAQTLDQVDPNFSPQELGQLEQAQAGALQTGSGQAAAESDAVRAGASARNRTLILWSVLVLGVLVLGAMAWRLVRQLNLPTGGSRDQ